MAYLKGAVFVHGLDDGQVSTDQTPQMMLALTLVGVPSHMYTVAGTGGGEPGATLTAIVADQLFTPAGQVYTSPLAGHGWEGSDTQLVIKTGFEQLFALLAGGSVTPGETVIPGL
jgi:hypothetical protein